MSKRNEKEYRLLPYLWVLIPIALMTLGQTFAKVGAIKIAAGEGLINIFLIAGYVLLIVRGVIWILIISKVKLVLAYPLMSLTYVIVLVIAASVFNEVITLHNVIGSAFIIAGVTVLSLGELQLGKRADG